MTDPSKIKLTHTQRAAYVYIRQSTPGQVEHNRESTARQYALAERACQLGWPKPQVVIVDEDLGLSGSSLDKRCGFARLTSEVALAHVGIVLGLEVSRLARKNADWYRWLELCGITDTLMGDNDGVYHPALFNDRLLGLKGTMSEAELHIIRARLDGGIRNKAARGELRRGWPIGFVWGEQDGEVRFHPDSYRRHPHGLRTFYRVRIGAAGLALVSLRRSIFSPANGAGWYAWPDPLGRSDLPRTPSDPHPSGVCWRLHVRQNQVRTLRR
jgi:DNA invertase Pin-like site-specific DNA recombinase